MKSCFLSIVVIITCSGCGVRGELEFYPDYKRSEVDISDDDWIKEPEPNPDLQRYLQEAALLYRQDKERSSYGYGGLRRTKPNVDNSWPNTLAKHLLINKDLALRLIQRNEKLHDSSRKPQYFKIMPPAREPKTRPIYSSNSFLSLLYPNLKPKERVEEEVPDFEYGDESDTYGKEMYDTENVEPVDKEEKTTDQPYEIESRSTSDVEFALSPADPGYFNVVRQTVKELPHDSVIPEVEEEMEIDNRDSLDQHDDMQERDDTQGTNDNTDVITEKSSVDEEDTTEVYITAVIAGIGAAATVGFIAFGIGWYNLQKHVKNASDVEYPAYGITGPNKDISPSGDRRLAQSAQMYHYQHQKQQIIAMERAAANERHGSVSEAESDEENEEGDYTVYECPGLAPTGEMEVKNPLFQDDPTPAQTPAVKSSENGGVPKK